MFKKILIANRGEIAVRVIRACQEMKIQTVAVYSTVDRTALHVQLADEAICIGEAPPLESYLNMDKLIKTARDRKADAIHPGYGFLAENSQFARLCNKNGLVFIGPGADAIQLLGDKVASRKSMEKANIPLIPGMKSYGTDLKEFQNKADEIGYPVILKASAGGGGKGMRIVADPKNLMSAIEAGKREAKSAFGDESVYLEKYIEKPRHIEFQVLADHHGNALHVFERECSIQRRHQKIVEETPSVALDSDLRQKMGETAVRVVQATGYTNAGTVEFLLDADKNFYFLEVNTRIQVEHPITEMVAGIDLVKWQIRIAAGEKLPFHQKDLHQYGHAIECRIYAENPENNFLPSLGQIVFMKNPEGPGIRVDSGIYSGYEVVMFYDPILSKLIVWGENREAARERMVRALSDYIVMGIETTIPFLKDVMQHPQFISGNTTTDFIEENIPCWKPSLKKEYLDQALIAAAMQNQLNKTSFISDKQNRLTSLWNRAGYWRIGES